jgi:serine/threonine-protein kinase
MVERSGQRGYETPIIADVETAFRRLFRFQVKLALAFLAVIVVVGGVVGGIALSRQDELAVVPDLRGLDHVGVASTLHDAGLAPNYTRLEQPSETVPISRVIGSEPPAGTRLDRGTIITVFLSCGSPRPGFCDPRS